MSPTVDAPTAISTEEKVRFLSAPAAYPERPQRVEVVETHLSFVFLAGARVYKLKKPVASEHFDFTSLAGREANCRKEVRLNRRLAAGIYLGVARLTLGSHGFAIDGDGDTIDWLVVMKRLPAECMLDRLIVRRALEAGQVATLAGRLAAFYAEQPPSPIAPQAYLRRFTREQATNRSVIAACHQNFLPERYARLLDRFDIALAGHGSLLEARVHEGRIVDGHGDLRPEHVCLNDPVAIFDCLEFSDELRQVDPLDELAYLGMECAVLGAAWIGAKLIADVMAQLGQTVPEEAVALYTGYRAVLRTRLTLAHVLDIYPRTPTKWRPLADRYALAAEAALAKLGS